MLTKMRTRFHNRKGQGLVEFALALPILLLLMLIIVELGHMLFFYVSVYGAAREGARYGAAVDNTGGAPKYEDQAGMKAAAQRVGFIAGLASTDINILYDCGISDTSPATTPKDCVNGNKLRVSVTVNATYVSIVPIPYVPVIPISTTVVRTVVENVAIKGDYPTRIPPTPVPTPSCTTNMELDEERLNPTTYPEWHWVTAESLDKWKILTFLDVDSRPPHRIKLLKVLVDPINFDPATDDPNLVDNNIRWQSSSGDNNILLSLGGTLVDTATHNIYLRFEPGEYEAIIKVLNTCPFKTTDQITIRGGNP